MKRIAAAIIVIVCVASCALAEEGSTEATLTFSSFEGGGPEISVEIDDPSIVTFRVSRSYDSPEGEPIPPGCGYRETYVFTGLNPGVTGMTVSSGSAIVARRDTRYTVAVDEALNVTLRCERALSRFWFTHGGYLPSRNYEVFMLEDEYYLCGNGGPSRKLDSSIVDELMRIVEDYDLFSWDGFAESAPFVLDGEGFCLDVAFSDGAAIHATGDNAFPEHYYDVCDEIESLLDPAAEDGEPDMAGVYKYEGDGFGGDFTITLFDDGTYSFYEGFLSSYLGGGEWYVEGPLLFMTEKNGMIFFNTFVPLPDALVFLEADSDNFPYVKVPDGGRFEKIGPAESGRTDTLSFSSFDGGGPEYSVSIGDETILSYTSDVQYVDGNHEELDGAAFTVVFSFFGLRPGSTAVTVMGCSPIGGNECYTYSAAVDESLNVALTLLTVEDMDAFVRPTPTLVVEANGTVFYASLEDNSSADALVGKLNSGGIDVQMRDYGHFEKVGPLPWPLPRNDETITTSQGDVILYQGSQITIYYDRNTWDFTRLARIDGVTGEDLLKAFGDGDVTVRFRLEWSE